MIQPRILVSAAVSLLACGLFAQETPYRFQLETLQVEPGLAERTGSLAAALGFAGWPRPSELYRAPAVGRVLFDEPARVAEEVRSCTAVRFGNEPWDHCVWSWKPRGEGSERSAADSLKLEITPTPSSRAAQELLLTSLASNMMTTDALVKLYQAARRPEGLGDIAVLIEARDGSDVRLSFTRANVTFRVRGYGALSGEVLPLARRLDERLLGQQPLTLEQLRAEQNAKPRPSGSGR